MFAATQRCSNCGKISEVPDNSELCPRCLLSRGLSFSISAAAAAVESESVLSATLLAGGRRFGEYELIEEAGRGGMGVVFKARHVSLNRVVALKLIISGEWASANALQRFTSEAEAAAWLDHPNIVPVYEVGQHERQRFLAMKFIEGPSLAALARAGNGVNQAEAARIVARLARAIHYAHSRGVIHRDLKPGNVLLDSSGEPHLTDFGLARQLDRTAEITQTSGILGTPAYLAPEQAAGNGHPPTVAVDIYALGGILYELLTGFPPFRGSSAIETIRKVLDQEPEAPSSLANRGDGRRAAARVDRDLEIICLKALQKEPAKRYASAEAMAEDLERWMRGEPILARAASPAERFTKWARRHPALAALYLVASLSIIALVIQQQRHARQWRAERDEALEARRIAEASLTRQQLDWADQLESAGKKAEALASWARILRQDPANAIAPSRIFHLLTGHNFMLPLASGFPVEQARAMALSPDHSQALIHSDDAFHLFEVSSHRLQRSFAKPPDVSRVLAWSSDGGRVALSGTRTVEVIDLKTGGTILPPMELGENLRAAFSADGELLFCRSLEKKESWLVDLRSGSSREWTPQAGSPALYTAALHPDGRRVLAASSEGFQYFDLITGKPAGSLVPANFPVEEMIFSRTAPLLILNPDNGELHFRDSESLQPIAAPLSTPFFGSAESSPDGLTLATSQSDNFGQLWDLLSGSPITEAQLRKIAGTVTGWTDSDHLLLYTHDGGLRMADSRPGQALAIELSHSAPVMHAEFSPDGGTVLTSSADGVAQLWNPNSGEAVGNPMKHETLVRYALFSPDGTRIASVSAGNKVSIWNTADQELIQEPYQHDAFVDLLQWHPRGEYLLVSSLQPEVRLLGARADAPRDVIFKHEEVAPMASFMPDGERLLTATRPDSADKQSEVSVWNINSGQKELSFRTPQLVYRLGASPDGSRLVTAHPDFTVRLWDAKTGDPAGKTMEHRQFVWITMFSPDSSFLLTAGADGTARVWDGATGEAITGPLVHEDYVWQAQFSPDASSILTQTSEGVARLWDSATGLPLSERMTNFAMNLHVVMSPSTSARFSPDSRRIVLPTPDDGVRILELSPDGTSPEWLPRLAEALSGLRLTETGQSSVNWQELDRVQREIVASKEQTHWARWGRWLFADRGQRSRTPFGTNSVASYIEERIAENSLPSLTQALLHDRKNPQVLDSLARHLSQETNGEFAGQRILVEHLRKQAALARSRQLQD